MSIFNKRRRGNMIMVVVVLVMMTLVLTGLFSTTTSQADNAKGKAKDVGQTNSYIALANMCADAFRCDLEGLYWKKNLASVENPNGSMDDSYGMEIYDEAIEKFQAALMLEAEAEDDGTWQYTLTSPYDAVEYAGVNDPDATEHIEGLLKGAKVTIIVQGPISVYPGEEDIPMLANGDCVSVSDIRFSVRLSKGTWLVEQEYCLTGEKLEGRYSDAQALFQIDGENAECNLERQSVSRRNINVIS